MGLDSPIRYLKGVGEKRASEFAKKGIHTVGHLLYFFPRSHEDRSKVKPIARCIEGETVCIRAKVYNLPTDRYVRRNMLISSMQVFDDSGMINLVWYNNKYVKIPVSILMDKNIYANAKLLYGVIIVLSYIRNYCFADNTYLAETLNTTRRKILPTSSINVEDLF